MILLLFSSAISAGAATITWTGGAGTGDYVTGQNWAGGVAPANNDYSDTAVFNTGAIQTIAVPSGRKVKGITFQAAGCTLSGGSFSELTTLASTGTGTNTLALPVTAHANATWNVAAGNTLEFTGSFYQRNKNITLAGGGKLTFASSIGGFSGAAGSWGIYVNDGRLRIQSAAPFQSGTGGAIFLTSMTSVLELPTDADGVEALVNGGRIVDQLDNGLVVDDIGGGYVEIFPAPLLPFTWTGAAGDLNFATAGNWSEGTAPANNDYSHTAVFSGGVPGTIAVPSGRKIYGILFKKAGWTLNGGSFSEITALSSYGMGANTLALGLTAHANATWYVDEDNTLSLTGSLYQRNKNIMLNGGGTLQFSSTIGGYSGTVGSWGLHVVNGTAKFGVSSPYSSGSAGAVFLDGSNAKLMLQSTVSGAAGLISSGRIIDGLGNGLEVIDTGGGTVKVVPISNQPQTPPIAGNWQLEFQDQFDGTALDGTKWRLGQHWPGLTGSAALAPENVTVSGGKLRIKSEQRSVTYSGSTKSYASGEVSTFFNFRQQYGHFEARIKYPAVTGLWPAFWLMPDRALYGWRDGYFRSYMKFDLTGVNPGTITSAELRLKVSSVESGGSNNVLVMKLRDDLWDESTLTWNNKPAPDPAWIAQRWNQATAGQDMVIDVKDFVVEQMAGDKKISFVLADTFMKTKNIKFHSSETANAADQPRLIINGVTYTATEDAVVRWGTLANNNYGNGVEIAVEDSWDDTATTYNGGMEVDIMETLGIWGPNKIQHAVHWNGYDADHQTQHWPNITYPATSDDFHIYGLYWENGRMEFYVDGVKTGEMVDARVMSVPAYLILSLQAGGWDNNNAGSQIHNQVMEVDWVRVWSGAKSTP